MVELISQDRMAVVFSGARAGREPLTWGQKAILQDMQDSGSQFNMSGMLELPEGSSVSDAAARLRDLMGRHAALRVRLRSDPAGSPFQEVAPSGEIALDILTMPSEADPADVARYADHRMTTWPRERFDFAHDWPLRMAVLRHRGASRHLVWELAHLVADGGAHLLLLADLLRGETERREAEPPRQDILDVARSEQAQQLRQLSGRAMRYWESQLRDIPAQTFGDPVRPDGQAAPRYWQARLSSPAAHLAVLTIARRTGTDVSRVTLALIATAIARATGVHPVTIKLMVNNRFRPGLADVIAPLAQNSVLTVDVTGASVDEVVARARSASLTAGMRAYYDPDDLREVMARLDAERGWTGMVSCRVNDQRAMIMRSEGDAGGADVTQEQLRRRLAETSLTWLGPRDNMHEQASILVENQPDSISLHMMWDSWSLTDRQVEELLRGVEEVAVAAAFDPAYVAHGPGSKAVMHR